MALLVGTSRARVNICINPSNARLGKFPPRLVRAYEVGADQSLRIQSLITLLSSWNGWPRSPVESCTLAAAVAEIAYLNNNTIQWCQNLIGHDPVRLAGAMMQPKGNMVTQIYLFDKDPRRI